MNFEIVVEEKDAKKRLDVFLSEKFDFSRSQIKNILDQKKVFLNGKNVKAGEKLKVNDKVWGSLEKEDNLTEIIPQDIPIEIVFENEDFAVINKPQNLVVHPGCGNKDNTLVNGLVFKFKSLSEGEKFRPGIVHRLDKDTSGLLLIAKNDKAHKALADMIKDRQIKKSYKALIIGCFKQDEGEIATGFGRDKKNRKKMAVYQQGEGKIAITKYKTIERYEGYSLVKFVLETGRTHQIRVHSSYLGHPIVGDELYGGKSKLYSNGQLLHAYKIEFLKPYKNEYYSFEVPLPEHFEKVLANLQLKH